MDYIRLMSQSSGENGLKVLIWQKRHRCRCQIALVFRRSGARFTHTKSHDKLLTNLWKVHEAGEKLVKT